MEYTGWVDSLPISGEAALCIEEDRLALITLFDAHHIPYADVNAFEIRDYAVHITAKAGAFTIARLGNACEPFYDELYAAYNKKVRKALFAGKTPLLKATGEYRYTENGATAKGAAPIEVYEDCILILPPNTEARRVPMCFVTAVEKGSFALTLRLNPGESYTFSKLGYDSAPFEDVLTKRLYDLRKKALENVKALDPTLGTAQASAIAKLMPEGLAARMGELAAIAPSFVRALEEKVKESRSAESYAVLKTICAKEQICVGIRKSFGKWADAKTDIPGEEGVFDESEDGPSANGEEKTMVWMIAPGENGGVAAVEFAVAEEESAATFVYRFQGGFESFARAFNRAIEAIGFKREVIRLSDDELNKPEYAEYDMAIKRNASLRFIRRCFAGRVIHCSPERWKQGLLEYMGQKRPDP